MIITTTDHVPGYEVEKVLGVVWGSSIRAKHVGKDIKMGLKTLIGGELTDYAEMLDEARRKAMERMKERAADLGADAVINLRFTTSAVMAGAAEIMAYGTAVKLKPKA